nr:endonuclease/exonuclease/phosphatase family protein [uncultured Acetatifactor sp.]
MKFVTFNIRYDCGEDGINNFDLRKPFILKKIQKEQADIICFQEVLPHVAVWLKENLEGYYVIGCGRGEDLRDEQSAIAYRKDCINLMKMDTYWLSDTPAVPGSRYPGQSPCPRICTEAVFEDLRCGKVFRVANAHLDHEGESPRRLALEQILKSVSTDSFFGEVPVIITGDFNMEPDAKEMEVLKAYPGFTNVTENIGVTYHGYWEGDGQCSIDFIIVRGDICCESLTKWTDEENGLYLSDHYPVCGEFSFGGAK